MKRRAFLSQVSLAAPLVLSAQEGPPPVEPIEKHTAGPKPAIALNHLGFEPLASKQVIFRLTGSARPSEFLLDDVGEPTAPFHLRRPLRKVSSDFGDCLVGDFSDIRREAMYQVTIGDERSVPFFIRPLVWRRTLPKCFSYIHSQRCGTEIPNVHAACHLDDARRRDDGTHVDTTGGWHDAGDLRKWMDATMLDGLALLVLARNQGEAWDLAGTGLKPLLDEFQWGNRYFLKMQDSDGKVWADVAGGVNGDNSDNHWTDNKTGTADDRYLNPEKQPGIQALFTLLQAMAANIFKSVDSSYSERCRNAAERCWRASMSPYSGTATGELCLWALAAIDLASATGNGQYRTDAIAFGRRILATQNTGFTAGQKIVRGFWWMAPGSQEPYNNPIHSAAPVLALQRLTAAYPEAPDAPQWRDAVKLHLEEYVLPITNRSAYRIVPFSLFRGSPTGEFYRPLAGDLTYRYFMPVRKQFWWQGVNAHFFCYATALARAARDLRSPVYRDLAFRQLEWALGANPFGSSLMTGEGVRQPFPHSRFVGLIPGGIMNGIAGNMEDQPILDMEYGMDWRTTEYWSPHVSYYVQAVSELELG
jgi:hypothetical protein